jgi:hypothetical protein
MRRALCDENGHALLGIKDAQTTHVCVVCAKDVDTIGRAGRPLDA